MKTNCATCKTEFDIRPRDLKPKNYCCLKCFGISLAAKPNQKCEVCKKPIVKFPKEIRKNTTGRFFCCRSHAATYNNLKRRRNWKGGKCSYRTRAIRHYGPKCFLCDYNIELTLEVHHVDRNRENNELDNLAVMCPNHHREITFGVIQYP